MEDHDEGFARNVRRLFGGFGADYEDMANRPLAAVKLSDDKERITFEFEDGHRAVFGVEGDCCSRSWIEHLEMPADIVGEKLLSVEDARISQQEDAGEYGGLLQVYNTRFRTAKGDIVLEYRNESNGYYGGYLVRIRE